MNERYQQTIDWMFSQVPMFQNKGAGAYKPGLDTMRRLCAAFGHPERAAAVKFHIAGTNGKGSTSSLIASCLTAAGRRTALYTSPHLVDFRERIRIDGRMIGRDEVIDFIDRYRAMDLGLEPSFFELTTVMAFDWFARSGADAWVIEVGLGGELDSTNVIAPAVAVITNISMDHTDLLGRTPAAIASQKAGIIKPGRPVVIGNGSGPGVMDEFRARAAREGAELIDAAARPMFSSWTEADADNVYFGTPWGDLHCPLTGACQAENANTALNALALPHGIALDADAIRRGVACVCANTGLMGRWTVMYINPTVVCDTGHNPGGWDYLGPRLQRIADSGRLHMVIGFVNDKDISHILCRMPSNARYYFTQPSVQRRRPVESLRQAAAAFGLQGGAFESVADAFAAAHAAAGPQDTVFVGGSTFVVADLLSFIQEVSRPSSAE